MEKEKEEILENANEGCPGVLKDTAGKHSACKGCPNQDKCSSGETKKIMEDNLKETNFRMKNIKHKILVLSGKGGVGKSTISAQLAFSLANQGFEVGLLDIDLCGPSIPKMLGVENEEVHQSNEGWSPVYIEDNLAVMSIGFLLNAKNDAVIWRGPRKTGLIKQFLTEVSWGELDFLIIDTPPGTSDEHISIAQMLALTENDGAVIVTTPQEVALSDVRKEISFCIKTDINIFGVVENMSYFKCPHCEKETKIFSATTGGAEKLCEDYKIKLLGALPLDQKIMLSSEKGKYFADQVKDNSSQAFISIKENLLKILKK